MRRFPRGLWARRRATRALEGIQGQLTQQNTLLARIADYLAPLEPLRDPRELKATTGVDHLDATELALVDSFVARTETEQGHTPTEEEILTYLADEQTVDLHTRLRDREAEVNRWVTQRGVR